MALPALQQCLPKKFLGFVPLYIGVELVLGITVLNKISGFYGMLSLFTGHPLDFMQCLYYLTSILVVPFYITMLRNLSATLPNSPTRFHSSTINKVSFLTVLYSLDTVMSLVFTVYFSWFWFSGTAEAQDSEVAESIADDIAVPNPTVAAVATGGAMQYVKKELLQLGASLLIRAVDDAASEAIDRSSESASSTYEAFFTISSIMVVSITRLYFCLVVLSFTRNLIKSAKYNGADEQELDVDYFEGNIFQRKLRQLELRASNYLKTVFK